MIDEYIESILDDLEEAVEELKPYSTKISQELDDKIQGLFLLLRWAL